MDKQKRGRGRPSKLPPGERYTVRCVLVGPEIDRLRLAMGRDEMSQLEFTRAAVLAAVERSERAERAAVPKRPTTRPTTEPAPAPKTP